MIFCAEPDILKFRGERERDRNFCYVKRVYFVASIALAQTNGVPNIHNELVAMRRELKDLEAALCWTDPPLTPRVRTIARAKIAKLRRQISELPGRAVATINDRVEEHERL